MAEIDQCLQTGPSLTSSEHKVIGRLNQNCYLYTIFGFVMFHGIVIQCKNVLLLKEI